MSKQWRTVCNAVQDLAGLALELSTFRARGTQTLRDSRRLQYLFAATAACILFGVFHNFIVSGVFRRRQLDKYTRICKLYDIN